MSGAWYKRYPSDFLHSTRILSCEEKGAYATLLDMMYENGGPIVDNPSFIARMCGCSQRKWTQTLRPRLIAAGKINVREDGKLSNGRMVYETHMTHERIKAARERDRQIIEPINQPETPAEPTIDVKPATSYLPIYRPDSQTQFAENVNENNTAALPDSETQKVSKKESLSLDFLPSTNISSNSATRARTREKPNLFSALETHPQKAGAAQEDICEKAKPRREINGFYVDGVCDAVANVIDRELKPSEVVQVCKWLRDKIESDVIVNAIKRRLRTREDGMDGIRSIKFFDGPVREFGSTPSWRGSSGASSLMPAW